MIGGKFGASHKNCVVIYEKWKMTYMKQRNQEDDNDDAGEEKLKNAFCFEGLKI